MDSMKVFINIRDHRMWQPAHDVVHTGIKALGHTITDRYKEADMIIKWTSWNGSNREYMVKYTEDHQKPLLIMENGWIPEIKGLKYYQLAFKNWNGKGEFYIGDERRWNSWSVDISPWKNLRDSEEYNKNKKVLVISQNGHPKDDRTSPIGWSDAVQIDTKRKIVRTKKKVHHNSIEDVWAAVTWSSNYAIELIRQGVPVFAFSTQHEMLNILAKQSNIDNIHTDIEDPYYPNNRLEVFKDMAWMQWSEKEIATGEPFRLQMRNSVYASACTM